MLRQWIVPWSVIVLLLTGSSWTGQQMGVAMGMKEVFCGGFDVRNEPASIYVEHPSEQNRLRECTVVEGNVRLVLITNSNTSASGFHQLPNIREITGYLLIFQVRGLESIGDIFPNLTVIGGKTLTVNYALVVFQNSELKEIGLPKLREISHGGVRIAGNNNLCGANNLDWKKLCKKPLHILIEDNKDENRCPSSCSPPPGMTGDWGKRCSKNNSKYNCLTRDVCQPKCEKKCRACQERLNEETSKYDCCDVECAGGCDGLGPTKCHSCRHIYHNGTCMKECPKDLYLIRDRRCLTRQECLERIPDFIGTDDVYYKPINRTCSLSCPKGFQMDKDDKKSCIPCKGICQKTCTFNSEHVIQGLGDLELLEGCNVIDGSLELTIFSQIGQESTIGFLEKYLGEIQEITGYLMISFTPLLISLSPFKNLRRIQGRNLYGDRYGLSVFENENIQHLFGDQKVTIEKGLIQFHNNPRLCYQEIQESIKQSSWEMEEGDVSTRSNGFKAVCDKTSIKLVAQDVSATAMIYNWDEFDDEGIDHRKFLGYQIYYKVLEENEIPDMSTGRGACNDTWMMMFFDRKQRGALVTPLQPNTRYAAYLKTVVSNHHSARVAISDIVVERTLFSAPTAPIPKETKSTEDSVTLKWAPPLKPNGQITHYKIEYQTQLDDLPPDRDYCKDPADQKDREGSNKGSGNSNMKEVGGGSGGKGKVGLGDGEGKCSKKGCCECSAKWTVGGGAGGNPTTTPKADMDYIKWSTDERSMFENAIHDIVFLQTTQKDKCKAGRRCNGATHILLKIRKTSNGHFIITSNKTPSTGAAENATVGANGTSLDAAENANDSDVLNRIMKDIEREGDRRRKKREVNHDHELGYNSLNVSGQKDGDSVNNKDLLRTGPLATGGTGSTLRGSVNVTMTNYTISNLAHFTRITFTIYACQNTSAVENFCSLKAIVMSERTLANKSMDVIQDSLSYRLLDQFPNSTSKTATASGIDFRSAAASDRRKYLIKWRPPETPNGGILTYYVLYRRNDLSKNWKEEMEKVDCRQRNTPCKCVTRQSYEENGGYVFIPPESGNYSLMVIVESLGGPGPWSQPLAIFVPPEALLPTWIIVCLALAVLCGLSLFGLFVGWIVRIRVMKKMPQYIIELVASNRDYIPTSEVYTPDQWELKRDDIEMEDLLGSGTFGTVYLGHGKDVKSVNGVVFGPCAVKTVKEGCPAMERLHFLLEANVMKQFNTEFIVKLYGVVSEGQPTLVIMELMENGNLRDYLRTRRPGAEENVKGLQPPSLIETLHWAIMIADGMAYLEDKKFVHRDLAARNCMVGAPHSMASPRVKIGDFGMARDIYVTDYYRPEGVRKMPVRHMSPEALMDAKFSSKSDVWAFGVVLWEMATLGAQPYAGLGPEEIRPFVYRDKRTMDKPLNCPNELYDLMQLCWKYDSRDRPLFYELLQKMGPYLVSPFREEFASTSFFCNSGNGSVDVFEVEESPGSYGSDLTDSDTPLNPLEHHSDVNIDFSSEFSGPVCNSNRRGVSKTGSGVGDSPRVVTPQQSSSPSNHPAVPV